MGSCISKFNTNKKNHQEIEKIVEDKLVIISQAPISCTPPLPKAPISCTPPLPKAPISCTTPLPKPPSSTCPTSPTSTSTSSFYCDSSTNTTTSSNVSLSSSSSLSSSIVCSKERPMFSNDYLWSCVKENPQVIIGKIDQNQMANKICGTKLRNNVSTQGKLPNMASPGHHFNKPKKRSRANSPNLTRQKSFRKEASGTPSGAPSRVLRSPSPTRRFNGDGLNYNYKTSLLNDQATMYKRKPYDSNENSRFKYTAGGKENIRPMTSTSRDKLSKSNVANRMNGEHTSHEIGEELPLDHEDVNNPHIALDCFIFL